MALLSRIAAAMDGLEAIIEAKNIVDSNNNLLPVDVGYPDKGPETEHIWIAGDVEEWNQIQALSGPMATAGKEEVFILEVNVFVAFKDSYKDARDRLFFIIGEVESALRNDFQMNNSIFEGEVVGGRVDEGISQEGRSVLGVVRVRCMAWLAA